jgi:hypothetical protein
MGNDLCFCEIRVGAEESPQVTTLVEPRLRFKYDSSGLYPCRLPLEWPPVQVSMGSCLHYYPVATCISVKSQFSSLFSIFSSLKQSSCSYCYSLVTCPKYLMSKSTALPVLIQGLQFSSLTHVAFCILWSEDSHILCVPHRSIQAGHVTVVMEVMEFIKNKRKELQRSWCDQVVTQKVSFSPDALKTFTRCATVAHICNLSYSWGRDQEDHGLKPAWEK